MGMYFNPEIWDVIAMSDLNGLDRYQWSCFDFDDVYEYEAGI